MNISNNMNINIKQTLNLTPYLKQSIEILKFSEQDLSNYVNEEILTNPALSLKKKSRFSSKRTNYLDKFSDDYLNASSTEVHLIEHLQNQVNLLNINPSEKKIIEFIIGNINKNGYLDITYSEIASRFSVSKSVIKDSIKIVQSLDPSGIGAVDLQECLLIQLERKNLKNTLAYKIIKNALEDLAGNKISSISKKFSATIDEIQQAKEMILQLNPNPANEFNYISKASYIIPDIIIKNIHEKYEVLLNSQFFKNDLEIDSYFSNIDKSVCSIEEIAYINTKVQKANDIIRSIEQRNKTLFNISSEILKYQLDFFKYGKQHLKKLTRQNIAKNLGIHESTVSRAVSKKFLECSFGVFELKYFFQSGINSDCNESISSEKIKCKIKDIVKNEDKNNPFSDEQLTMILESQNIKISRRCVAKYRTDTNIPSSSKRKKY